MIRSSEEERAIARRKLAEIAQRLQRDPAYRQELHDRPLNVLTAAGLHQAAIDEVIRHHRELFGEVAGHGLSDGDVCAVEESCFLTELEPGGATTYFAENW